MSWGVSLIEAARYSSTSHADTTVGPLAWSDEKKRKVKSDSEIERERERERERVGGKKHQIHYSQNLGKLLQGY